MTRFIKRFTVITAVSALLLYAAVIFVLPKTIDINKHKSEIQTFVKEKTGLNTDFSNPELYISPLFSAGIKGTNFSLKLDDGSEVVSSELFDTSLSLPSLLFGTLKMSKIIMDKPVINLDIVNGKEYKVAKVYRNLISASKKTQEIPGNSDEYAEKKSFDASEIKFVLSKIKLTDYTLNVNDLKTSDTVSLKGDELIAGYNAGKNAFIKTNAKFLLNDAEQIFADVDLDTFLPKVVKNNNADDETQRVKFRFINPVAMYKTYNLKANLRSKLKIRKQKNILVAKGFADIDNFTLMLSGADLPESDFHIKTNGKRIKTDALLFVTEDEKIDFSADVNYSSRPSSNIKLKTTQIHAENVLKLLDATLKSLHIKNELHDLKASGVIISDIAIKTNFKKLKSSGYIAVNNFSLKHIPSDEFWCRLNSYISFDKNMLDIQDTFAEIAKTVINIKGSIDARSMTDINFNIKNLPIERMIALLYPENADKYKVNSGVINIDASVTGEMKKALANLKLSAFDIDIIDTSNDTGYTNKSFVAELTGNFKTLSGKLINENFKLARNGVTVGCDNFNLTLNEKDIELAPGKIKINDAAETDYEGYIKNYLKNPIIKFTAEGNVRAVDIKRFLGNKYEKFLDGHGILPVKLELSGDALKQKLKFSVSSDADNYITPVHISELNGKNTVFQTEIDFKGSGLKIKNTGLFVKNISPDEKHKGKYIVKLSQILGIDGTVTKFNTNNPNINTIKFKMPAEINGKISIFPKSSFRAKGQMFLFGDIKSPGLRGGIALSDFEIPELLLNIEKISSEFQGKEVFTEFKNIELNSSDYNILINSDINPFTIKSIKLISEYTDIEDLISVNEAIKQYFPEASDITAYDKPVIIKSGRLNISKIKSGNIYLEDFISDVSLNDKVLVLNNIITSAFQGKIRGVIALNLNNGETRVSLNGCATDVKRFLTDVAGLKDTLSGIGDFDLNLAFSGNEEKEIIKNLKGILNFTVKNGAFGSYAKLENLVSAKNIIQSPFFKSAAASAVNSAMTLNTEQFNDLSGNIVFDNGYAQLNSVKSVGNVMSAYICGNYDMIKNLADIELSGRLSSSASGALGTLSLLNPVNIVKAAPNAILPFGDEFISFSKVVPPDEIAKIPLPAKESDDNNTNGFIAVIKGDVYKSLSLVKSFKWLVLESDMQNALDYIKENASNEKSYIPVENIGDANETESSRSEENFIDKLKSFLKKK